MEIWAWIITVGVIALAIAILWLVGVVNVLLRVTTALIADIEALEGRLTRAESKVPT